VASATATPVISRFGVRQFGMNDLATYAYAGRAPGVATVAATRTYAATGPIGATVGTAFGTGWRWGGMRQGQYVFANVNGQDTLVDTRNSAFYLRQR